MSDGGGNSPYIYLAANSGRFDNGLSTEVHEPNGPLREVGVPGPAPIGDADSPGRHLRPERPVRRGPTARSSCTTTARSSEPPRCRPISNLNTFTNNNNWIGRSQWNDPVFDGLFNELRLYNHALTASEVGANSILGPDALGGETLKLEVNKNTGAREADQRHDAESATSTSTASPAPASALSLANWNSLDDQNFGAVDGDDAGTVAGDSPGEGFDQIGASGAGQLVELYLGATGATINASQSLSLGNAFNTSVFGAATTATCK